MTEKRPTIRELEGQIAQLRQRVEEAREAERKAVRDRDTVGIHNQKIAQDNDRLRDQLHAAEIEAARLGGRLSAFEEIYEEPVMIAAPRHRDHGAGPEFDLGRYGQGRPHRWFHRP